MKLTITVQSGSQMGRSLDLTEGFLTVGRGGNCNLLFDPMAENMVSTKHAYIETKPDGFYLVDTKSTNGTFVNGNTVQITKLNSGDTIQFGKNGPQAIVTIEMPGFQSQPIQQSMPPIQQSMPPSQQGAWGEQFQTPQFIPPVPNQNSMSFIGLSNPVVKVEPEKSNVGKIIGAVVAVVIYAVLGLVAALLIMSSVGIFPAIIASVVAFTPAFIYILPLMFLDRYDPEPPWLIAAAFAWGGIVAVVFSFIVNTMLGQIAYEVTGSPELANVVGAVISAPIFEELSKGLGVVLLLIFFRREFDDILDGIVYGGVIGLGFATVENVLYYGRGVAAGVDMLLYLLIIRGLASPFIHVTFTAMTGIGCGIARESHNWFVKILMPILGYIFAVFLHMAWNGTATFFGGGFWFAYGLLGFPFFLICIGFCIYIMFRQNRILREMLAIDVARGLITDEQLKTVTSVFKSTAWLIGGLTSGKYRARSRFLRSVGKLGLSYWHIQRATAAQGHTGSFQSNPVFRADVEKWRGQV
ncbi:MAG: PrsW family glutamic-type intramembrane protease [Acidobacteriota bacterium]